MLLPSLITAFIFLGVIFFYVYYLAPRMNPLNRAENYIRQNMKAEAEIEYRKILERNPSNFLVHYKLADLYFNQDMIDQGVIHLEDIVRINKYNYEVDKLDVLKKLAKAYILRGDTEEGFQAYFDILGSYPGDEEALYEVSFIALGQEYFDLSYKYFDRLTNKTRKNFEVLFGSGVAAYQLKKINEASDYFKSALSLQPKSDIANLAMAFALREKKDFGSAISYLRTIVDNSEDKNAIFLAKRFMGILYYQAKKSDESVKIFEDLFEYTSKKDLTDEMAVVLYDLGFAYINDDKTEKAYQTWNQVYQIEMGYKNIQRLITVLRREMDSDPGKRSESEDSVAKYAKNWLEDFFPENFLWDICGLKSDKDLNLKNIMVSTRILTGKDEKIPGSFSATADDSDVIEKFWNLDVENFRITANRLVAKIGYRVDDILESYREPDGVDFMGRSLENKSSTLIWVRRWKGVQVGEIPLRNFAQAINDSKASQGLFVTTSSLTPPAVDSLSRLNKVTVIDPDQVSRLLSGIL